MNISNGIKIVEGVALGKLRFYRAPFRETNPAPADDPVYEQVRFESARKTVLAQRRAMKDRVRDSLGKRRLPYLRSMRCFWRIPDLSRSVRI